MPAHDLPQCPCSALPPYVEWLRCLGPYDGSLRRIVHALKYDGRQTIARRLGFSLRPLLALPPGAAPTTLVPVPLHPRRGFQRGFNQALLLARALGLDWPIDEALVRVSGGAITQTRFGRRSRRANVATAFAPRRTWLGRPVEALAGRPVLLVDDVMTTGATLAACARVARAAGATWVGAVVVARTEVGHRSDAA